MGRRAAKLALALLALTACGDRAAPPGGAPPAATDSPEVWCPDRSKSAATFSIGDATAGNTQVMVTFHDRGGGSGVFAVDLPDVPLRVRWKDDATLVIAYPAELRPSKQQARTQHYDQAVVIEYETYAGASAELDRIRARLATAAAAPPPASPAIVVDGRTLRGRLLDLPADTRRNAERYCYTYYDVDEPDPSVAMLQAAGYQGGGPSWAGIIYGLVRLRDPALLDRLRFDDEGDGLALFANDRDALLEVADLVTAAKLDAALMQQAIATAVAAGRME